MRRLILVFSAAIALVAAMIGVGWSVSPQRASVAAATRADVHKVFFRRSGGYAACSVTCDSGGKIVSFAMPGRGTYRTDITMTFQYRTEGLKSARASLQVGQMRKSPTADDKQVGTHPTFDRIAVAPQPTTTTMQLVLSLKGGKKYELTPLVLGTPPKKGAGWSIYTEKVVYSIDATPVS